MGTFFVTQKIWEFQGRRIARREVERAKAFVIFENINGLSWKEKLFGEKGFTPRKYRVGQGKLAMV
jgi:hypothetical protein